MRRVSDPLEWLRVVGWAMVGFSALATLANFAGVFLGTHPYLHGVVVIWGSACTPAAIYLMRRGDRLRAARFARAVPSVSPPAGRRAG